MHLYFFSPTFWGLCVIIILLQKKNRCTEEISRNHRLPSYTAAITTTIYARRQNLDMCHSLIQQLFRKTTRDEALKARSSFQDSWYVEKGWNFKIMCKLATKRIYTPEFARWHSYSLRVAMYVSRYLSILNTIYTFSIFRLKLYCNTSGLCTSYIYTQKQGALVQHICTQTECIVY
jgi:hypothetical protein